MNYWLRRNFSLFFSLLAVTAIFFAIGWSTSPNAAFPTARIVTVPQGEGVSGVAQALKDDSVVRFAAPITIILRFLGEQRDIQAGEYSFSQPISAFQVAWRIARGQYNVPSVRITIPEGTDNVGIAAIIASSTTSTSDGAPSFPHFNSQDFLALASGKEGYLFPDTYFFPPDESPQGIIASMEQNFSQKIVGIAPQIAAFGKTEADAVIMASILEKEARTSQDRRIIAGILWKRLSLGIPLEVDSTIEYATGRDSVKSTDLQDPSPYNTYLHSGLPPTPIANPGLESLTDAVTPIVTDYLYFLADKNGDIHYAETFAEHEANIAKYLD